MESQFPAPVHLAYRRPADGSDLPPARSTRLFRAVLALWLLPLVGGVTIFTISEVTRPDTLFLTPSGRHFFSTPLHARLEILGQIDVVLGTISAAAAFVCILLFVFSRRPLATNPWRQIYWPAVGLFLLLVFNFASSVVLALIALR